MYAVRQEGAQMTPPLSVQLYALGAAPAADPAGVIARLAALGYEAVEPLIQTGIDEAVAAAWVESLPQDIGDPPAWQPLDTAVLKQALDEHGLIAPSSHVTLPEGAFANEILDEQEMLGCRLLIAPALFNGEAGAPESFSDLDRIKQIAERFNLAAEKARARGMRVGYHNHFWEFGTDFDGRSGLEVFFEMVEPDVVAEIDIHWAYVSGCDPAKLVKSLGERVVLLHIRDGDKTEAMTSCCPLGEGEVDLPGVLAEAGSVEWLVAEPEGTSEEDVWPVLEQYRDYLLGNDVSR